MKVVDAQVHPWAQGESTGHHRRDPITSAVLQKEMEAAGVDRVVLVPPLWDPHGNVYALEMARQLPDKFTVMGLLDAARPDAAQQLRHWRDQAGMRGVRFLLNTPDRIQPWADGLLDPLWPIAEETGLVVAMLAPGHLQIARQVAQAYPRLKLIVDHLGVPRGAVGATAFKHLPELLELAQFPNVRVKAVGVGDYAMDPYPFKSLEAPLRQVFDAFGADRVIWGSDLSRLHHSYAQCVAHFREHLPYLGEADLARVMGQNILDLLEWK
ncbi:amidohydrolase family protein [Variovorax sp. J2P1-59]|uniref:amidohydrolase family protein n=1 Tax=Variovorax flavidus TaxID=3053501 RepID=UPI0025777E45|nr:amidohydrolase family protein [Variovorax sp. J2P1-59]MDM0075850.1 amidohydrolase family protein [Variovorax sp. J2P1-59]